jgi:tetratricopeptide (TPR) repeat protein
VSLARPIADRVARHLVAAGRYLDEDPELSYEHAVAARRMASRIGVVREAVGLAAYKSGQWQTAVSELRTYHRMSGKQTHLAILADCERALGRPERAIDLYRSAERQSTNTAETIELLIVAAGARADMGQNDAAVAMLQIRELTADAPWVSRLRYAYADSLLTVGRREEAREWFARAVEADPESETDAAERLLDLDGITLEEDDESEDPDLALKLAHDEIDGRAEAEAQATTGPRPAPAESGDELVYSEGAEGDVDDDEDVEDEDDDDFDAEDDFDEDDDEDDDDTDLGDDLDDEDVDDEDEDEDEDEDWELYEPPAAADEAQKGDA